MKEKEGMYLIDKIIIVLIIIAVIFLFKIIPRFTIGFYTGVFFGIIAMSIISINDRRD